MEFKQDYSFVYKRKSENEETMINQNKVPRWALPAKGWCKLNAHATCIDHTGQCRFGGVIRDENGRWLNGYTGLGTCGIFTADLRAIKEGLVLAWNMRIKQIIVEIYSTEAVCALLDPTTDGEDRYPIITDCKVLINRDWQVQIRFQPLSKNRVPFKLATMEYDDSRELIIFPQPPTAVMELLLDDYRFLITENRSIIKPEEKIIFMYKAKSEREEAMLNHEVPLMWTTPGKGWCKLNVHASHVKDINHYGIGGVIRDENGHWLKGYTGSSGEATMFTAGLSAVKEGLILACRMGIKQLIVESNSTGTVSALLQFDDESADMYPILKDCRNLVQTDWTVKFSFQPLCTNKLAYKLARMGHDYSDQLMIFDYPPAAAIDLLLDDYRWFASVRK